MQALLYEGQFFTDIEDDLKNAKLAALREQSRLERQQRNRARAIPVLARIRKVESIDLFEMTKHIDPDWFGEKSAQYKAVRQLYVKQSRLLWYLRGLYHYLSFGESLPGFNHRKRFNYSYHRAKWQELVNEAAEKRRQKKWDDKRAKVQARRAKRKTREDKIREKSLAIVFKLRNGAGFQPPV